MQPMTLSEFLDRSVYLLRRDIKSYILYNFLYAVVTTIAIVIVMVLLVMSMAFFMVGFSVAGGTEPPTAMLVVFFSVIAVIIIALTFSYQAGIVALASRDITGAPCEASKALITALKSIPRLFLFSILALLPAAPVSAGFFWLLKDVVPSAALVNPVGASSQMLSTTAFYILFLVCVYLLLMLLYTTTLCFAIPALIVERRGVIHAIRRSFRLVSSHFWRIFGIVMLIFTILFFFRLSVYAFVGMLGGLVALLVHFVAAGSEMFAFTQFASILNSLVGLAFSIVFTPLSTIMMTLFYLNRRFETEGYDLSMALNRVVVPGKDESVDQ